MKTVGYIKQGNRYIEIELPSKQKDDFWVPLCVITLVGALVFVYGF